MKPLPKATDHTPNCVYGCKKVIVKQFHVLKSRPKPYIITTITKFYSIFTVGDQTQVISYSKYRGNTYNKYVNKMCNQEQIT